MLGLKQKKNLENLENKTMNKIEDAVGTELHVNDYIAYAVRVGNSAYLKIGRITEFKDNKVKCISAECGWRSGFKRQSKASTLDNFERMIRVSKDSLSEDIIKELA